jgi:hypothetical protein
MDNKTQAAKAAKQKIPDNNPREAAQYIAELALELRNLAKANNLSTLQGLLEVAYYEAFGISVQQEIPQAELEHLAELRRAAAG